MVIEYSNFAKNLMELKSTNGFKISASLFLLFMLVHIFLIFMMHHFEKIEKIVSKL